MYDPIKPDPTPLDHLNIPIALNLWQVNYLLKVLGKRPLEEVQGVFLAIQQQGNAAVAQATAPPPPVASQAEPPTDFAARIRMAKEAHQRDIGAARPAQREAPAEAVEHEAAETETTAAGD